MRVKVAVPECGLGRRLNDAHVWLARELGPGAYAVHPAPATAPLEAVAFHFRELAPARRFIAAFPDLALADGVESVAHTARGQAGERQKSAGADVCNLYSLTKGQATIRDLARAMVDRTGNLPSLPGIFPDQGAPVVRNGADGRELAMARWGMPSPAVALKGKKADPGVTNIRNTGSPHWRRWLGAEHRCLVPLTSFAEYKTGPDGSRRPVWFALDGSAKTVAALAAAQAPSNRPLAFFAGLWTRWTSVRKVKEGEVTADLFGFLTTEANATVGAIHPTAMPVILTAEAELDTWLEAPVEEALALQRPLPDDALAIIARGEIQDSG